MVFGLPMRRYSLGFIITGASDADPNGFVGERIGCTVSIGRTGCPPAAVGTGVNVGEGGCWGGGDGGNAGGVDGGNVGGCCASILTKWLTLSSTPIMRRASRGIFI